MAKMSGISEGIFLVMAGFSSDTAEHVIIMIYGSICVQILLYGFSCIQI